MYIKSENLKFASRELAKKIRKSEDMEERQIRAIEKGNTVYAEKLNARIEQNRTETAAQIEILNRLGLMVSVKVNQDGFTETVDIIAKF